MSLKDKVIILTGAASGIGRSTAKLLAKRGAFQILSDIDEDNLKETYELLENGKNRTEIMKIDVRKSEEVKKMVDFTIDKFDHIDVVIANAGVVRVGPVEHFPDEDYELLIDVNLKGTYYTCKHVIPQLKKQKSGIIITLASVAGHIGQVNHANYCSTKHGILGFTKALAL
ncbi:MAG: SDR family oxidoreductase, partial [Promethearchaeota archaeon]